VNTPYVIYYQWGVVPMNEWTTYRLTGKIPKNKQ